MKQLIRLWLLPFLFFAVASPIVGQDDLPERPDTASLLPETTQLFVQIGNIREYLEKVRETGVGQVFENEKVANLVDDLYSEVENAYEGVKEDVGLELEDFQNFPQGELTFAIIAPARDDLQYAFFIEVDEESESFKNILKRGREVAEEQGDGTIVEEAEDITFETFTVDDVQFTTFLKDGLMVGASNRLLADQILDRWNDVEVADIRPLTQNRKFVTVMNRCRGTKDVPPDLRLFIDPIGLAKGATRGDAGAQIAINFLPILGLDGLSAIGVSVIMDELGFETVGHMHVMLANPRAGIIKMLALKPGDYTPEPWVPENAGAYISTTWDFNVFYAELEKIVDTFGGEGTLRARYDDEFEELLKINLREDFLPIFTGRVSYTNWLNYPVDFSGQVQVVGLHIADMEKFEKFKLAFFNLLKEEGEFENVTEREYRGSTYWMESEEARQTRDRQQLERRRRWAERNDLDPDEVEVYDTNYKICVGLIDDVLIICTNPNFFEAAVDTALGEKPALADSDEFNETTETITKLLRNDTPGAIFYQQPGKTVEYYMELAKSDAGTKAMKSMFDRANRGQSELEEEEQSDEYRFAKGIRRSLEENPLPDFEEIQHLFAPAGGFITNDETGYHIMTFQLKN